MEMRACEDTEMGVDVTHQIPPLAFSLSDHFLRSRCSACFRPLKPQNTPINSNNTERLPRPSFFPCDASHCNSSVLYCSRACHAADSDRHVTSGECHLISLFQSEAATWQGDSSDLRAALRLLRCFETLGLGLGSPPFSRIPMRIGGLMSNRENLEECEILERIREGGRIMSLARKTRENGERVMEETVFCVVLTNAVEVQVSEVRTLGIAVYGPCFSWFNHSCSPSACYWFALTGSVEPGLGEPGCSVYAAGEEATLKSSNCDQSKLVDGSCRFGPRIVVRSIKPIKKSEEVCVAYTDLLQPKAMRQSELWSKYQFHCNCNRCNASPPTYVDRILQEKAANLDSNKSNLGSVYGYEECNDLSDCLELAITEYMSDGNPEACCKRLENMLAISFQHGQIQMKEPPAHPIFKLPPLHHISLSAYMTLASAYSIRASCLLRHNSSKDDQMEAFVLGRASAAYSLLLAGRTHHLFLYEPSLIPNVAHFWISAGESLLDLVRGSIWSSIVKRKSVLDLLDLPSHTSGKSSYINESEIILVCCHSNSIITQREGSRSLDEFENTSKGFLVCLSRISSKAWSFLTEGVSYLKYTENPIDFSWLGMTENTLCAEEPQVIAAGSDVASVGSSWNEGFCASRCEEEGCIEEERLNLFRFAVHCLLYGGYLSSICYGPQSYLIDKVQNLLFGG